MQNIKLENGKVYYVQKSDKGAYYIEFREKFLIPEDLTGFDICKFRQKKLHETLVDLTLDKMYNYVSADAPEEKRRTKRLMFTGQGDAFIKDSRDYDNEENELHTLCQRVYLEFIGDVKL